MKYENLVYLIVGICIGVLFSLTVLCGRPVVIEDQEVSFLINDFMGYEDVHLIQFN